MSGVMKEGDRHGTEPSGTKGDNPATPGADLAGVGSKTPVSEKGHLNPSAPEDANTTPGTTADK